jgi:biotin carboxyl carrier protein
MAPPSIAETLKRDRKKLEDRIELLKKEIASIEATMASYDQVIGQYSQDKPAEPDKVEAPVASKPAAAKKTKTASAPAAAKGKKGKKSKAEKVESPFTSKFFKDRVKEYITMENFFVRASEIAEGMAPYYPDKTPESLRTQISSVLSTLGSSGELKSFGESKRNTFWGLPEWLLEDGTPNSSFLREGKMQDMAQA